MSAADFADALGDRVGHGKDLAGLLVQQQMIVPEVRSGRIPVEILGLQIKREDVSKQKIKRALGEALPSRL